MPENPYTERTLYVRDDRTGYLVPYTPPPRILVIPRSTPPRKPGLIDLAIHAAAIAGIILIVAAFAGVLA